MLHSLHNNRDLKRTLFEELFFFLPCSTESRCSKEKGYTFLKDIFLCIKSHNVHVYQRTANKTCYQEGGYLVKIDNPMKQTYIQQFGKFKSNYKMNLFVADQVKHFTWQIIIEQTFNLGQPRLKRILTDVTLSVFYYHTKQDKWIRHKL